MAGSSRGPAEEQLDSLAKFCHDLRQYVAAGLLLSQMPGDDQLEPDLRRRMSLLHQQFAHAADLIAAQAGELRTQKWRLDLVDLVNECVDVLELTRAVKVEFETADHAFAYGDPVLLRRAVVNVLDNASRAVGHLGTITVRVGENLAHDEAWVEIADDGLGFGQIDSGTGHGLAIVTAAVRACEGRLQISSGPGPGTAVRMTLPTPRKDATS